MVKEDNLPVNELEVRKFFVKKLAESGYSLQTKVEQRLIAAGYYVQKESPYIDHDKAIGRHVDILARTFSPRPVQQKNIKQLVSQLSLIIECKNLPDHGWIFFGAGGKPFILPEYKTPISIPAEGNSFAKNSIPLFYFAEFFSANGFAEFIYDAGKKEQGGRKPKSNEQDTNLYEAVMSVIKATRHYKHRAEKDIFPATRKAYSSLSVIPFLILFQSVIVFKGHMYRSEIVNDHPVLTPIKFVELEKNYVSGSYNEIQGAIHIVSYDHFEEYLKIIQKVYSTKEDYILLNQENINNEWQGQR